jgi:hypothetical protein
VRQWQLTGTVHYLYVTPSKKAVQRERHRLREMTDCSQSHKPLPRLIAELNRNLSGFSIRSCSRNPEEGKLHLPPSCLLVSARSAGFAASTPMYIRHAEP